MRDTRKNLSMSSAELAVLQEHAAELGVSTSSLGREWIFEFIETGSDYVKPTPARLQVLVESDVIAQAEAIAKRDYGTSLTEIIRHKIRSLRE